MLVLGVDPGSITTGYGLIEKTKGAMRLVDAGAIHSPGTTPLHERVHKIFLSMSEIMNRYHPAEMAIENVFFAKNVKSALILGHARAAALIAAANCGIRIFEYSPLEIKKSAVGYGRAGKEQVQAMVKVILNLPEMYGPDTSDALAAAICHLNWTRHDGKP
jgi:crossover junction endodeoxyribonuclease RuvC